MGYTHYWEQSDTVPPAAWLEFAEGAQRLVALVEAGGVPLNDWSGEGESGGRPLVNGKEVSFNGTGDESHESFRITRKVESGFCKTARKQYDTAVAACLLYLDSILPDYFEVKSDGGLWNYRDALALAKEAWPLKANQLDYPRKLRQQARFESCADSSSAFQVVVALDGVTYIEERATLALRRLPADMQGAAYGEWTRTVPHDMRRWGSFSAGDHSACETKRLAEVWRLSEANPVAPILYNPLIHGLRKPEITSAFQW